VVPNIVIGSVIDGKFLIKELLGQGGMGSVYVAEHTGTGRRCAVKVISSGDLVKDKQVLRRFEREARAAGAIDTQYITQVLDAGLDRESGLPFLAMEYMDGEDLQHLLKRVGPIAPELALRVLAQSCLGLQKAHEADVVHRDIKPHNLFLAKRDAGEVVVKILDFGIAKVKMDQAQNTEGADLTKTGNLLGSPLYVSPEQARGKRAIDHRTDIYSLGAVAYQMLSGQTPYEHATALGELILMVCTEPPPPVQDYAPWVKPELAAIVQRCLEKSPDARYQSAGELFEAIKPMLTSGWAIHEDMLVSLADSQRLEQAPRLPMSMPPPAPGPATSGPDTSGALPPVGAQTAIDGNGASTTGPLTQSQGAASQAAPPKSSKAQVLLGGAAVAAIAITAIVFAMRDPAPAQTAPPEPTVAQTTEPSETAAAAPSEAPVGKKRRVRVVILPSDASVEVEGEKQDVRNGILDIEGTPGSVHRVRVFKGKSETTADVVVTLEGAVPPKIEVKIGKKLHIPKGGGTARPPAGGQPPPASVPTGIQTDTNEFD
jgi:serine/threonine protein kinase